MTLQKEKGRGKQSVGGQEGKIPPNYLKVSLLTVLLPRAEICGQIGFTEGQGWVQVDVWVLSVHVLTLGSFNYPAFLLNSTECC